jgi:hypothetical protein
MRRVSWGLAVVAVKHRTASALDDASTENTDSGLAGQLRYSNLSRIERTVAACIKTSIWGGIDKQPACAHFEAVFKACGGRALLAPPCHSPTWQKANAVEHSVRGGGVEAEAEAKVRARAEAGPAPVSPPPCMRPADFTSPQLCTASKASIKVRLVGGQVRRPVPRCEM